MKNAVSMTLNGKQMPGI